MKNEFDIVISKMTDFQLLKVLFSPKGDYDDLFVEKSEKEFKYRNISTEQIEKIKLSIQNEKAISIEKSVLPLNKIWRILTFFFPGFIQFIFVAILYANGNNKKANDLIKWTFYGFVFYLSIFIIIKLFL